MGNWLTIELALAVLLVTTFTCVGLLALWAATSRRHWFVRFTAVIVVLSPFILIPAHELFFAALMAVCVTCLAMTVSRVRRQWIELKESSQSMATTLPRRFSLASTLLLTAALAMLLAIVVQVPVSAWWGTTIWMSGGATTGISIFMLSQLAESKLVPWQRVAHFSFGLMQFFISFMTLGMGMEVLNESFLSAGPKVTIGKSLFWFAAALVTGSLIWLGTRILNDAMKGTKAVDTPSALPLKNARKPRWYLGVFLTVVAALPLLVVWELLNPLPILADPIPTPNGHDRLVQLGKRLANSAVEREYTADPIDYAKLAIAVKNQSTDYTEVRDAIALPGWIPVYYDEEQQFADMDGLIGRRKIARALSAKCEIATRQGDMHELFSTYIDMLHLAEAMHRGGHAIDFLIATACEGMAHRCLFDAISQLDVATCVVVQEEIAAYDERRRGIEDVLYRERSWTQRAFGWTGHFVEVLGRLIGNSDSNTGWNVFESVTDTHRRERAVCRLLMIELALRAYQQDEGLFPMRLDQLIPTYIAALPVDPFDASQQPPVYAKRGDGYLLYSLGPDGIDDGGQSLDKEFPGLTSYGEGDLRLDLYLVD